MNIHSRRLSCRLCESPNPIKVLPLQPVPVGEHYSQTPPTSQEMRFPIDIYHCDHCGAVQTQDDIASDFLWNGYTYFSGQTRGIIKHFQDFVSFYKETYGFPSLCQAFDIGSNDGSLLKCFEAEGCSVYGIDPSDIVAGVAQESGIPTFIGLFSDAVIASFPTEYQTADIITAFNVFAHSPDMPGMIRGVKQMLKPNGIFCFEVQYLGDIVNKKLLGTVFHEHMIHYSVTSAKNFLEAYDMKLINFTRNPIQMGSIIFFCAHQYSDYPTNSEIKKLLDHEKYMGLTDGHWGEEFSTHIYEQVTRIQEYREMWTANGFKVVGYGAARSGPTLAIQFGLENCLEYVLDDHPSKCGKFGVFESIAVHPTQKLYTAKPDVVIVLAWIHTKKIIQNNVSYLELGGRFISLWPNVAEVTIENLDSWLKMFDQVKQ
ncbi:class I SAM-dependent methyltransferase [Spirulina major]|uniref:class I SAM-dependent methyltransferase n=1 Tax=Spirulina major TaxID=270636 RepID=UPI001C318132|nr:class I SAM-dependent methyltransferase [Spirulina major]